MKKPSVADRIIAIVGEDAAEQIFQVLDEEHGIRCRDTDCLRRWPHSRISRHRWRHEPIAPHTRGLFGWKCFICGQANWRRIHRKTS